VTLLQISGLEKRFGGLVATAAVDLTFARNELHAIIGPNGAGKTTLIAQIAGDLRSDAGSIRLGDTDITHLPPHARCQLGLARSFQISNIFSSMSAEDNVALSIQTRSGHSFRFWRRATRIAAFRTPAREILRRVGLDNGRDIPAAHLAHGERRQLELAMAIGGQPKVLLLDEPMAGLGLDESVAMVALLRTLKQQYAIILVEHDMDAVFALADRVTVLFGGRVLASGAPAAIRNDPAVRAVYLGKEHLQNERLPAEAPSSVVIDLDRQRRMPSMAGNASPYVSRCEGAGEVLLDVQDIDAGYQHCRVLSGVSLEVRKGEVIALLGRNGMGKSTLLKTVIGALKPERGTIRYLGDDVTRLSLHQIVQRGIGLVPEGRHIFRSLTVEENLRATARPRSGPSPWTLERIFSLFPRLRERRRNMGDQLSGGEQQMLAIGRALMTNPSLLILDEATEGLAPIIRAEVWHVLEALKSSGQSIIVVDKDVEALSRIADRHYLLEKGRVIWSGGAGELDGEIDFIQRHISV
jgi:ABC-type branched-subunit amino acid transport system ATPase component